jgi:putative flippase GtrA
MHSAIIDENVFVVEVDLLKVSKVCCKMHPYMYSICNSYLWNEFLCKGQD